MFIKAALFTSFLLIGLCGEAAPPVFESGPETVALVELYSSEGCSSCPPADAWISQLTANPALWKSFVPVVFHVDYWDQLGWRDRFASRANTERQERYAAAWRADSVYTPEMVLNGREWRNWRSQEAPPQSKSRIGILRVQLSESKVDVTFISALPLSNAPMAEAVLLGMDLTSDVTRGENGGRKLRHDFVVVSSGAATLKKSASGYGGQLTLSEPIERPRAVAAWVRMSPAEAPLQAVGGWLPEKR